MRQPFSEKAERIFMKLLPNDTGKMEFETSCRRLAKVVSPPGEWRMLMICVIYADSCAITRGRHARRLRYKIMSWRMDLI